MILLGAGTSVPFGIPAMKKFVELFKQEIENKSALKNLFQYIESSLNDSERLIGYKVSFDLESLMVVLKDLAIEGDKPISPATFAFTLFLISSKEAALRDYNIKSVRDRFAADAKELLGYLQSFVFEKCIAPIRKGQQNNIGYSFLDAFYGAFFSLINQEIFRGSAENWIFSTNWDLCLKQWLEYARIQFEDGIQLDANKKPVLRPSSGWSTDSSVKVVPLHGSFDLINCTRFFSEKTYAEIEKVSNPEVYFTRNPSEISKAFIVYPLEAVGYDETLKSPYLDMLILLKKRLENENNIFVAGFSFRDSIIASIFDEVVRKKSEEAREKHMRVLLLDSEPEMVIDNLKRQGYINIANLITPVRVSFPDTLNYKPRDENYIFEMESLMRTILESMRVVGIPYDGESVAASLGKFNLRI